MQRQYDGGAAAGEPGGSKIAASSRCASAGAASVPPMTGRAFAVTTYVGGQTEPSQEAQIRADARGGSRYDALLDISNQITDQRAAGQPVRRSFKSWLPPLPGGGEAGEQTLIAPWGLPIIEQRELGLQAMRILA